MYITAQGPCLQNDLYCVEWDIKLYYTVPFSVQQVASLFLSIEMGLFLSVWLLIPYLKNSELWICI